MLASTEKYTSTGVLPGCVPWLQSTAVTVSCEPFVALGGPLTCEVMKSGLLPTPIRLPVRALYDDVLHWEMLFKDLAGFVG